MLVPGTGLFFFFFLLLCSIPSYARLYLSILLVMDTWVISTLWQLCRNLP